MKEAIVVYFKALSQNLPGKTKESHKRLHHNERLSHRDSNPAPLA